MRASTLAVAFASIACARPTPPPGDVPTVVLPAGSHLETSSSARPPSSATVAPPGPPAAIAGMLPRYEASILWRTDGTVWTIRLGVGGTPPQVEPLAAPNGVARLAQGGNGLCALTRDGKVWCWNGEPSPDTMAHPVDGVDHATDVVGFGSGTTCALIADGSVRCWGTIPWSTEGCPTCGFNQKPPTPLPGLDDAVALAGAGATLCVLRRDRTVACLGTDSTELLGADPAAAKLPAGRSRPAPVRVVTALTSIPGLADEVGLAMAAGHACVLGSHGAVRCWGGGFDAQPAEIAGVTGASALVCGGGMHSMRIQVERGPAYPMIIESVGCARVAGTGLACWSADASLFQSSLSRSARKPAAALPGTGDVVGFAMGTISALASPSVCGWNAAGTLRCWSLSPGAKGATIEIPLP